MNANELSDELKDIFITLSIGQQCEPILLESATMLRQQQAEIEALKWQIDVLKDDVAGWFDDAQGGVADDEYFTRLFERAKNERRMSPNELSETDVMVNTIKYLSQKVRQQQAEIEALKKHNGELQKACVETLVWVMGNGGYCSLDIEVILKNVLGSEWEDYK